MQAQVEIKLLRRGQPQACAEARSRAHTKEHPAQSSLAKVAKKVAVHDCIIHIESLWTPNVQPLAYMLL